MAKWERISIFALRTSNLQNMEKKYRNIPDEPAMASEPAVAYGHIHTQAPVFSSYQMQILDSIANVKSEQELCDIKNLIAEYFSNKALDAIDKLCEDGTLSTETIQSWQSEHMRTPYKY